MIISGFVGSKLGLFKSGTRRLGGSGLIAANSWQDHLDKLEVAAEAALTKTKFRKKFLPS